MLEVFYLVRVSQDYLKQEQCADMVQQINLRLPVSGFVEIKKCPRSLHLNDV